MSDLPASKHFFDVHQQDLPEHLRAPHSLHDDIARQIEAGRELTGFQSDFVLGCVRYALQKKLRVSQSYAAAALHRLKSFDQESLVPGDARLLQILSANAEIRAAAEAVVQKGEIQHAPPLPWDTTEEKKEALPDPAKLVNDLKEAIALKNFPRVMELADTMCASYPSYPKILFIAGVGYLTYAGSVHKREDLAIRLHYIDRAIATLKRCKEIAEKHPTFKDIVKPCSQKLILALREREKTVEVMQSEKDKE